jgi:uncharacterized protein
VTVQMANALDALRDLHRRIHAVATALVSQDGQVLHADLAEGAHAETFSVMCATVLGAAVAASAELGRGRPVRVVVESHDSRTVIVGAGERSLLVTVTELGADRDQTISQVERFASLLGSDRVSGG